MGLLRFFGKTSAPDCYSAPTTTVVVPSVETDDSPGARGRAFARLIAAKGVRLDQTLARYPHVVDKLAAAGHDPARLDAVIVDLLIDDRGDRQGFPPEVLMELAAVRELWLDWRSGKRTDRRV
jgi:hypothetical protein